ATYIRLGLLGWLIVHPRGLIRQVYCCHFKFLQFRRLRGGLARHFECGWRAAGRRCPAALTGAGPRGAPPRDPLYARQGWVPGTPALPGPRRFDPRGRTALRNFAVTPRRLGPQCQRRGPRVLLELERRGDRTVP